jgi:hypothetical protein
MSVVHLHLLLNHVPVIGAVLGVLILALAVVRRNTDIGKLALGLFALIGAASIVVFLTGEPAEELVERLPDFSEAITERHEEAALVATIAMAAVGALALFLLGVFRHRPLARWAAPLTLVLALGATGLMGYAANLGGQVRHTEIRAGSVAGALDERPDGEDASRDGGDRR